MIFAEVPIYSERINELYGKTPVAKHLAVIREDFEEFHKNIILEDNGNKIEDLQHYKTELFSTYCLGLLSTLDRTSQFNKAITSEFKG